MQLKIKNAFGLNKINLLQRLMEIRKAGNVTLKKKATEHS